MTAPKSTASPSGFHSRRQAPTSRSHDRPGDACPAFLGTIARQSSAFAMASALAEEAVASLGARSALVYLADEDGATLRLAASHGEAAALPALVGLDGSACRRVSELRGCTYGEIGPAPRAAPAFAFPLVAGNRLVGAVSCEAVKTFEPWDSESLASLGRVVGVMIDWAQRAEEAGARAEWSRVVVHEVRQPLGAMLFAAASLAAVDCSSARFVRRVTEGVERVDRLLGDLLDTSLVDIANISLRRRPTDIGKLASGLADETPGVRVVIRGDIPHVDVDPERIRQVLANLLANAAKYRHAGSEIALVIELFADEVILSVTNEGEDIPKQERSRIFDRYYRCYGTRKGTAAGCGIGLYVCRGLVEAHGGRMSVESGRGTTTFSFGVPLSEPGHQGHDSP